MMMRLIALCAFIATLAHAGQMPPELQGDGGGSAKTTHPIPIAIFVHRSKRKRSVPHFSRTIVILQLATYLKSGSSPTSLKNPKAS
jgi:hypothetical protein